MGRYISRNFRWHPSPTYHSGKHLSPPRKNNDNSTIRNFTNELSKVLNEFTELNHNIVITGDFNINLLEINECEFYGEFLDMMIFPKISLPTRKCKTKVSLIDQNFFCRFNVFNKRIKLGIILGATCDQYAYFSAFEICKAYKPNPKFVRINIFDDAALESFVAEVRAANIFEKLDKDILSDPTQNYNVTGSNSYDQVRFHRGIDVYFLWFSIEVIMVKSPTF